MPIDNYAAKIKELGKIRSNNSKQLKKVSDIIATSRKELKAKDAELRDITIKVKGLNQHCDDLHSQWLAVAKKIAEMQQAAKKSKSKDVDPEMVRLDAQATDIYANWKRAFADAKAASDDASKLVA